MGQNTLRGVINAGGKGEEMTYPSDVLANGYGWCTHGREGTIWIEQFWKAYWCLDSKISSQGKSRTDR